MAPDAPLLQLITLTQDTDGGRAHSTTLMLHNFCTAKTTETLLKREGKTAAQATPSVINRVSAKDLQCGPTSPTLTPYRHKGGNARQCTQGQGDTACMCRGGGCMTRTRLLPFTCVWSFLSCLPVSLSPPVICNSLCLQ